MTQDSHIHFRSYTFRSKEQKQALRILAFLQDPLRSGSAAVVKGILESEKAGFAYRLEQFLYKHNLLDKENIVSAKDVNAIAPYCDILGYAEKKPSKMTLLIDANTVEKICPGILFRLNKDEFGQNIVPETDYYDVSAMPKNILTPV